MIQHDSSEHRWSPYVDARWHLITSLDDYSRYLLYATIVEHERRWDHIVSLESVWLPHGLPLSYYVDSHSIFRFVERRDAVWKKHYLKTDEIDPQWKRVTNECRVQVVYALSAAAKGKIERPYRWLQDRIVRLCAREGVRTLEGVREVLRGEVRRYNEHQVHSTTGEIPLTRFERALREGTHLFRPFKVPYPFESTKDIFCIREERTTNAYRKVSIDGIELRVAGADPYQKIELRMVPDHTTMLTEIRFWSKGKLMDIQKIKTADLKILRY
ncbi:MAG TPA: hypothetical protein VKF36_13335 [Syntrophorhabdales bacterium]|nr:hypothetical protein [Syntrophorhabdales bacterium]